jgi:putative SbcD/Mre11-related phosphoesterase
MKTKKKYLPALRLLTISLLITSSAHAIPPPEAIMSIWQSALQMLGVLSVFLELVKSCFRDVIIIRGNHDTYLPMYCKEFGIEIFDFFYEDKYFLTHGHIYFDISKFDFEYYIIGHEHPSIILEDDFGGKHKLQRFLEIPIESSKKIIVLPSFSKIFIGSGLNLVSNKECLSPYLKKFLNDNAKVLICDLEREITLGKIKKIFKRNFIP